MVPQTHQSPCDQVRPLCGLKDEADKNKFVVSIKKKKNSFRFSDSPDLLDEATEETLNLDQIESYSRLLWWKTQSGSLVEEKLKTSCWVWIRASVLTDVSLSGGVSWWLVQIFKTSSVWFLGSSDVRMLADRWLIDSFTSRGEICERVWSNKAHLTLPCSTDSGDHSKSSRSASKPAFI